MTTEFSMSAGTYYIGDLCYVMHKEWDEFCGLTINENACLDGKFVLNDGREFVTFGTMYGDGVYSDNSGKPYGVDAGLIGAIKVEDISEEDKANIQCGNVVVFEDDWVAKTESGVLFFGDVVINTGDEEEDEDYWPEEDEDFWPGQRLFDEE